MAVYKALIGIYQFFSFAFKTLLLYLLIYYNDKTLAREQVLSRVLLKIIFIIRAFCVSCRYAVSPPHSTMAEIP